MKKFVYCIIVLILAGCAATKVQDKWHPTYRFLGELDQGGIIGSTDFTKSSDVQPDAVSGATKVQEKWHPVYRFLGGLNHGGIIENTDFTKTTDVQPDAFSGATKLSFNAGAHALLPVFGNSVETGLDFMNSNQTFTFNDKIRSFTGTRKIGTSQIMLPITYNFGFFKEEQPLGMLQLKFGYLMQFNLFSVSDEGSVPADYTNKGFSSGMVFGLACTPFQLANGNEIGIYLDLYRGSKIYNDFYNSSAYEMPGSSFAKFGIIYQF
jgi:hypothetical protein